MDWLKEGRLRDIYVPAIVFLLVLVGGAVAARVGPYSLYIAVSTGNTAPVVFNGSVALNGTVSLTDGGKTQFTVNFNVTDADGTANIDNTKSRVNITYNGITLTNDSGNCVTQDASSTTRTYSCMVAFSYFNNATTIWSINLTAADNAGSIAFNDSLSAGNNNNGAGHNVSVGSLSAFKLMLNSSITSANLGDTNKEVGIVINNTGNFDFTQINVTPYDLNASLTDFFKLGGGNFSINATQSSSSGFGDSMVNATPMNVTDSNGPLSATLPHKTTNEGDRLGNRTLYIYIDVPSNKGLSSGVTYNSSRAWEVWTE
ncbi:hypothetical protein HYU16_01870 [Candidatus Woesearchaeota archaeon]|nr:hypothetical protein [Candidatus Woesearchaeota archaeon]MBI2550175.1 hypothetical protein [Candidatus Woesearchaeota archaeon]